MMDLVEGLKDSGLRYAAEKLAVGWGQRLGIFYLIDGAPAVIVVGAQKCGTTSLYHYLKSHPAVLTPARRKEAHYFDRTDHYPDVRWYRGLFRLQGDPTAIETTIDITPSYCFWPAAISRIHAYNPHVRLVMLVRDPVKRAVSHYWMVHRRGREPLPMAEAFAQEDERIQQSDWALRQYSYKARGRYHEQIAQIYQYFPPEQVFIRRTEDLAAEPERIMRELTDFIGIAPLQKREYEHHSKKSYPDLSHDLKMTLSAYFAPHNRKLTELTGLPTDDWT